VNRVARNNIIVTTRAGKPRTNGCSRRLWTRSIGNKKTASTLKATHAEPITHWTRVLTFQAWYRMPRRVFVIRVAYLACYLYRSRSRSRARKQEGRRHRDERDERDRSEVCATHH